MDKLNEKLGALADRLSKGHRLRIGILGLGSVGNFLLNYLQDWNEEADIYIGCRNKEKAEQDVNISRVAAIIRGGDSKAIFIRQVDLSEPQSIRQFLQEVQPDFLVNASRVYRGLKYGSISWANVRAYGLWAPLALRFIKNIMAAHSAVGSDAIVINTSYSDAVIAWLQSAGLPYPDFGSGNLNHLVPRIKLATGAMLGIQNMNEIEVVIATSHFHDVVVSKEGQTEGVDPLVHLSCRGETVNLEMKELWRRCALSMPSDARRNMMNASSNFEIISRIVCAFRNHCTELIHSPGVVGHVGGYPVIIDGVHGLRAQMDTRYFSLEEMQEANQRSIYLDGIENVEGGSLTYTSELVEKVKERFHLDIPRHVPIDKADDVAELLIHSIIEKFV